jgi:CheY-like chemotaxis protein
VDTGIGIAKENLGTIFGAFQQADGTTSRRYGGTGLGLSISRQVANLLGGEIQAESQLGRGSTFTLLLPVRPPSPVSGPDRRPREAEPEGDRSVLVVEAPENRLLTMLIRQFAADLTGPGEQARIDSVNTPDEAIDQLSERAYRCVVVDAGMPGATAMTLLQRLADGPLTVPVLVHPTSKLSPAQHRLIEAHASDHLVELVWSLDALRERFLFLLTQLTATGAPPAEPPVPLPVPSVVDTQASPAVAAEIEHLRGRRVLLVDDDSRNVLALAEMLNLHGIEVAHAPNGRKGIDALLASPGVDLILMDVMMPEMDGYATTAAIRDMPQFDSLPIIMVTAKAMAGDREKSLDAGASDYVTKPVDPDELLTCIGRWLPT